MTSPPLLSKPHDNEALQLYLAISQNVVSVVLVPKEDKQQFLIYYVGESLLHAETRYSSMEKLLLALVIAAKKLREYFEYHPIIIVSKFPIKYVLRKPELIGRLAKWSVYLSSYDIKYKPKTAIKS